VKMRLDISHLLCFITGAEKIPPLGFNEPIQIHFLHDSHRKLATSNTCVPCLNVPTAHDEYEDFKEDMIESVVSGVGFPLI